MLVLKVYGKDLLRKDTEVFESQTGSWRIIRLNWNLIDLKEIVTAWLGWEAISKWQLWNQYCDFETLPVIDLEKSFRMIDCVGWATLCNAGQHSEHTVGNTVLGAVLGVLCAVLDCVGCLARKVSEQWAASSLEWVGGSGTVSSIVINIISIMKTDVVQAPGFKPKVAQNICTTAHFPHGSKSKWRQIFGTQRKCRSPLQ